MIEHGRSPVEFAGTNASPACFSSLRSGELHFLGRMNGGGRGAPPGRGCRIVLPLARMTKAAALRLGIRLGVPLGLTWSCYRSGPRHCGRCLGCVERRAAFQAAKLRDDTGYSKTPRRQGRQDAPRI